MEGREKFLKEIKKKKQNRIEKIKELEEDPKIKEYLSLKEEIEHHNKHLIIKDNEYFKLYREKCSHPMYAIIGGFDHYRKISFEEVHCILCEQVIVKPLEKLFIWLDELYDNKRLLARYINICERTTLPRFTQLDSFTYDSVDLKNNGLSSSPLEAVREDYQEAYLRLKDKESAQDTLFDMYCDEDYKRYKKDKILKKIY